MSGKQTFADASTTPFSINTGGDGVAAIGDAAIGAGKSVGDGVGASTILGAGAGAGTG
jgi:hypothetical protein